MNNKMTQGFDEWFNENFYDDSLVRCAAKSAWDKRQAEIDELQNRIDKALKVIYSEKSKVECDVYQGADADLIIGIGYDLHLILKGNKK